jgi:hypothetical protein
MAKRTTNDVKTEMLIDKRRIRVAQLLLQLERPSVRRIADQVDASKTTVHRDIQAIRTEWREARLASMDEHVERELAKINLLEQMAWTALGQSGGPKQRETTKERTITRKAKDGTAYAPVTVSEAITAKEGQVMDAKYMNVIAQLGRDRRTLLGLDKMQSLIPFTEYPVTLVIGSRKPNMDIPDAEAEELDTYLEDEGELDSDQD